MRVGDTEPVNPNPAPSGSVVPIDRAVRIFIGAALLLVGSAAASLLLLPEHTATAFSWTIRPPLTAAWLGAGYAAAFVALAATLRRQDWRDIRVGVAVVAAGLVVILVATLLHLDRFHWNAPSLTARLWAWAWLTWYVVLPPALLVALIRQRRHSGGAVAVASSLPRAFRIATLMLAAAMAMYGVLLFFRPDLAPSVWPWALTPLTARMVAAWWLGVATALVATSRCRNYGEAGVAAPALVTFAALQALNLLRYREQLGAGPLLPTLLLLAVLAGIGFVAWHGGRAKPARLAA
jgi:hypothetical protein